MSASMYQNNSKQRFGYDTIIIIVGIFILLFHLIDNPSLWGDEIALALNIVKYDLPTLLTTPSLDYLQSAPPGYLFFVKIFSYLGPHDWCLRLAATLATAFAFWTFNKLLKLLFEAYWLRCVVLLLFVASPTVLFHGVELKQYAFDLLANTLLLHAVVHFLQQLRPTLKDYGYLAAVGLGGVWFSNALYFSLAGLGILLFVKQWQKKTIDKLLWVVLGAWVLGILANYVLCVLPNKNVAGFVVFWQAEFPPLPVSAAGLRWYFLRIFFLFDNAFGLSSPLSLFVKVSPKWSFLLCFNYAAFALVLLGLWHLWWQKKWLLGIFTLPLLVAYALALLQKYPFYERFLLFYTPSLYIIIGYGLWWCWQNGGRWAAQVAIFLLLLYPLSTTLWAVLKPNTFALYEGYNYGNLREVFTHISTQKQPNDRVYLVKSLYYGHLYYNQQQRYPWQPIMDQRTEQHANEQDYLRGIEAQVTQALAPLGRCFFVCTTANKARYFTPQPTVLPYKEEEAFVQSMKKHGRILSTFGGLDANVYLVVAK